MQAGNFLVMPPGWRPDLRDRFVEEFEVNVDPSIDMKTPPKIQVDTMPASKYFAYAAEILKLQFPCFKLRP
jgi:hypothetical protein